MEKVYTKDRLPEKAGEYFAYSHSEGRFYEHFNPESTADVEYWRVIVEWWIDEDESTIPEPVKKSIPISEHHLQKLAHEQILR